MKRVNFSKTGELPDGTPIYDLYSGGELEAERIPLEEVVEAINRRDEESLGERHVPGGCIR